MAREFILRILEVGQKYPILNDMDHRQLPKDIRTTIKSLSISPELHKQICCPTCFSLYQPSTAPWLCTYKKSSKARECGEALFELKGMYQGARDKGKTQKDPSLSKNVSPAEIGHPRNIYVTQKLSSWLQWFL